ncbi:MAG: hypothetical protein K9J06_15745 [Flavobacteriales bacterium]|nr:hypothetical protein [Flavobacteriales bacterium]
MNSLVETTSSILSFRGPDMVRSASKPHSRMTLADIKENAEVVRNMIKGRPFYLIIVAEETADFTVEAREYVDPVLEPLKKAEAIVVRSLAHRILGTLYARTRRKNHPIRMFGTEWEAMEWIDSLRAKEAVPIAK